MKAQVRAERYAGGLDAAARDLRYGLRQLRRNPGFSTISIATLALGIGGITATFSAFDAILVRPMPYADAEFDVVLSMFGVMFAAHADRVMSELARVTRPGGNAGNTASRPEPQQGLKSGPKGTTTEAPSLETREVNPGARPDKAGGGG